MSAVPTPLAKHLHATTPERASGAVPAGSAVTPDALLHELCASHLRGPSDLVPDDPPLLARILSRESDAGIAESIAALLASGELRRVVVGREPHLALPAPATSRRSEAPPRDVSLSSPAPHPGPRLGSHAPPAAAREDAGEEAFAIALAVDAERERGVLLRVAIVLEMIVLLVVLRGVLLGGIFH